MNITKLKIALILIALGFVFLVLDVSVPTGLSYNNKYQNTNKVIGEFQYYTIKSNYNARCTYKMVWSGSKSDKAPLVENKQSNAQQAKVIDKVFFKGADAKTIYADIFSDILGFIMILIGCLFLYKCSKRFAFGIMMCVSGIIIKGIILALPFITNGINLVYAAFFMGIFYLLCNLITIFLVVSGLLAMIPGVWCRDERKWCKLLWYAAFATQALFTFIFWLGSDYGALTTLSWICCGVIIVLYGFFFKTLLRAKHYIRLSYEEKYQ